MERNVSGPSSAVTQPNFFARHKEGITKIATVALVAAVAAAVLLNAPVAWGLGSLLAPTLLAKQIGLGLVGGTGLLLLIEHRLLSPKEKRPAAPSATPQPAPAVSPAATEELPPRPTGPAPLAAPDDAVQPALGASAKVPTGEGKQPERLKNLTEGRPARKKNHPHQGSKPGVPAPSSSYGADEWKELCESIG